MAGKSARGARNVITTPLPRQAWKSNGTGFARRPLAARSFVSVADPLLRRGARYDEDAEGVPRRVSKDDEGFADIGGSIGQDCRSERLGTSPLLFEGCCRVDGQVEVEHLRG